MDMYSSFLGILESRKMSIAQVAHGTGIKESVFSNWKSRGGYLSMENALKVASYLNISLDLLATGAEPDGASKPSVLTSDEERILSGYRAATPEMRGVMMDVAVRAGGSP